MGNDTPAAGSHVTYEIVADWQQFRRLREYVFFGVSRFVVALLVALGTWLRALDIRVFDGSMQVDTLHAAMFRAPVFVMASLVAASLPPQ